MGFQKKRFVFRIRHLSVCALGLVLFLFPAACKEKTHPLPAQAPKVTVSQPVQREVTEFLDLTGNTQAVRTVQLVARVSGYLEKVLFKDGQPVKQGQLLFLIQQNTYQENLRQTIAAILQQKAQLEYAETQLVRYSNLLIEKAASQSDVDNWRYQRDSARANLQSAEAQRELAVLNLGYTEVCAPFDGRIDRRQRDPGNLVGSGENTVLAEINQIDPIYVYLTISDIDLARLMKSDRGIPGWNDRRPVFMGLAHEDGYPHQGHLDFASISLTATTGTLLMRGTFPNPEGKVLPGLYARVHVPVEKKTAFLVPEAAIATDQQGPYVLIVNENNTVERRGIKTGGKADTFRVVEQGISGREWVIVKGQLRAAPGRKVTPERETAPPPSEAPAVPASSPEEKRKP
jgi:RND family efflux transporter MFP subunit